MFTTRSCVGGAGEISAFCNNVHQQVCKQGETCQVTSDGYYIIALCCAVVGAALFILYEPTIKYLQALSEDQWRITAIKQEEAEPISPTSVVTLTAAEY
jgi:hypothetical protein